MTTDCCKRLVFDYRFHTQLSCPDPPAAVNTDSMAYVQAHVLLTGGAPSGTSLHPFTAEQSSVVDFCEKQRLRSPPSNASLLAPETCALSKPPVWTYRVFSRKFLRPSHSSEHLPLSGPDTFPSDCDRFVNPSRHLSATRQPSPAGGAPGCSGGVPGFEPRVTQCTLSGALTPSNPPHLPPSPPYNGLWICC